MIRYTNPHFLSDKTLDQLFLSYSNSRFNSNKGSFRPHLARLASKSIQITKNTDCPNPTSRMAMEMPVGSMRLQADLYHWHIFTLVTFPDIFYAFGLHFRPVISSSQNFQLHDRSYGFHNYHCVFIPLFGRLQFRPHI